MNSSDSYFLSYIIILCSCIRIHHSVAVLLRVTESKSLFQYNHNGLKEASDSATTEMEHDLRQIYLIKTFVHFVCGSWWYNLECQTVYGAARVELSSTFPAITVLKKNLTVPLFLIFNVFGINSSVSITFPSFIFKQH